MSELASTLSEDEALRLVQDFRERFGWAGTEFLRADVEDAVVSAMDDDETGPLDVDRAEVTRVADAVMAGYTWKHLDDRMAELGNELIADAILEHLSERSTNDR
jgi:hypothetical protein